MTSTNKIAILLISLCLLGLDSNPASAATATKANNAAEKLSPEETLNNTLNDLLERARQAMALKQYSLAVRIYTKLLEYPAHQHSQDAFEYLGVARERNGQFSHAKKVYREYIEKYKKTADAKRVEQRLVALETADLIPKKKLRAAKKDRNKTQWQIYGGLSQYYRVDVSKRASGIKQKTQSRLDTNLDYNARLRSQKFEIKSRFTGGYDYDFLTENTDKSLIINSLYVDVRDFDKGLSSRLGRQSQSKGGVLGRFDGLTAGYQFHPQHRINFVAGFPVQTSTKDAINTSKHFYGFSIDSGTFAQAWDFNAFYIQQSSWGMLDRQAVGGEVRYFRSNASAVALLDYDIHYQELNTLLFLGHWTFDNKITINGTADLRNSPILTTNNALIGQGTDQLLWLLKDFNKDEIEQLAVDRTANSESYTLGISRPLGDNYQVNATTTMTTLGDTPASGGVEAMPGADNDSYYSMEFTANHLFMRDDFSIVRLRQSNTSTASTVSLQLNSRLPLSASLRLNPRLRMDSRTYERDDLKQLIYRPSIRLNYRWKKRYHFETEIGGSVTKRETFSGETETDTDYYLNIGYRIDV